jgi:hypothetical protein
MLANPKRRKRSRKGRMPAGLARYWATHSRRHRNPNPPRRRHRSKVRRRRAVVQHVVRYRRNPGRALSLKKAFSTDAVLQASAVALGMVAPSKFTDVLLPMVGFQLTGLLRRAAQLAVPVGVQMWAPRLLGKYTASFVLGGYGVVALGLVNDFTGSAAGMVGGYQRVPQALAGYTAGPRRASAGAFA